MTLGSKRMRHEVTSQRSRIDWCRLGLHSFCMESPLARTYFVKQVYFTSRDRLWSARYLQNREERITSLLSPFLGNLFWENYAKVRLNFEKEGWLVLRIKSVTDHFVCFTQAWTSEARAEQFSVEALRGVNMMRILETRGVSFREEVFQADEEELRNLISDLRREPHIFQVVAEPWRTPDMKIGDPMKVGKLYLPFPE